jgi:[protein-PII] uridylyltransferase
MSVAPSRSVPPASLDAPALKAAIARHHASLARRLEAGEDGLALGQANARFLNACFRLLFEGAKRREGMLRGVALAAVGSFGRGAVAVRSDADVVLLIDAETTEESARAFIEALLYPLWDAGLQVGHQILGVADSVALAHTDLPTATGLLDLRFLSGDEALLRRLEASATEGLFSESDLGTFIDRLDAESSARHERFGGSVYLLEPDVKSGPGGMRDVDGARWAARARYRVGDAPADKADADDGIWKELVRLGVLVAREAEELAAAEGFMWRLRNRLHLRAGRKSDRLGFEEQEALGVDMGYGVDRAEAAERLMQAFYLHARTATRGRASLFTRLRPVRRRARPPRSFDLGGGVQQFDGYVTIAETAQLHDDPALALRTYAEAVRRNLPILPFAREAITVAANDEGWCEKLRASTEAASTFVELVCSVPQAPMPRGSILGELHDVGLLLAMVPELVPVTGRVHHDVYHVYTVDVHSIAALDRLRQLARGELAHDLPLASRLAAEITRPRPLFLATLLHDIGKGSARAGARREHAQVGAELCERILARLGFAADEIEEARELVRDHLLLYEVATRRDLQDKATIDQLSARVRGRGRLRNLYLLAVSDVSTTSPGALTSWKARMLEELYFATEEHLSGRATADAEQVARVLDTVRAAWVGPRDFLDGLVTALPERYFLASDPASIVEQVRAVAERGSRAAYVVGVPSRHPGTTALCIVADDRPGLLASIAAVLTANWLEILTAEVFSHPVGAEREALDLFWVRDRDGTTEGVERVMARLARDLEEVCSGRVKAPDLLRSRLGSSRWRDRAAPAVETEILFDDRASPRFTIVEVYARDRPGLLHDVAQALYDLGLSISLSKINTEGTRVADVFYVREADGRKVAPGERQQEIRAALVRAAAAATTAATTGATAPTT